MPYTQVALQPGQEIEVKDEMPFSAECHQPGPYEIRFSYRAALLTDPSLVSEYMRKYPVAGGGAIAWEDAGHKFIVAK
jgi:hypothetical protein